VFRFFSGGYGVGCGGLGGACDPSGVFCVQAGGAEGYDCIEEEGYGEN